MSKKDTNPLIQSLMRLRKRYCRGVSAACMTTNTRMAKDNAEFQKLIRDVEALITERDEARQEVCIQACDTLGAVISGSPSTPQDYAKRRGWDCYDV